MLRPRSLPAPPARLLALAARPLPPPLRVRLPQRRAAPVRPPLIPTSRRLVPPTRETPQPQLRERQLRLQRAPAARLTRTPALPARPRRQPQAIRVQARLEPPAALRLIRMLVLQQPPAPTRTRTRPVLRLPAT